MAAEYSISAAAAEVGLPERTLRDWIKAGTATALPPVTGKRGARISAAEVERLREVVAAASGEAESSSGGEERRPAADSGEPAEAVADSGDQRRDAANLEKLHALELELTAAKAERDAAVSERDFLRERLVESEKGEAELRVLMLRQSEQIQALQEASEQRALPAEVPRPAEPPSPPTEEKKRQWWQSPDGPREGEKRPWWRLWG